ncbi:MAG TPA: ferredoxin-type protein NapF [Ramlibacter sp.]
MTVAVGIGDEGSVNTGRRRFLRFAPGNAAPAPIRPPWALAASEFLSTCTRCDECARACPTRIIVRGDGGYPEVSFRAGECTFCGACAEACTPRALSTGRPAWRLQPELASSCLARGTVLCRACADVCERGAIRFTLRQPRPSLQVDASACNGCGACVRSCPVSAISMQPAAITT